MNNAEKAGHKICGHNIKRFDIPFMWKRMLVHGINPPTCINNFGKKPWEVTALDTAEIWSGGAWQESFTSLETLSALFGIHSPKSTMQADRVHHEYWAGNVSDIGSYCEGDVVAQMDVFEAVNKTGAI
jgi:DNA polymerase elongation subunit (family B)